MPVQLRHNLHWCECDGRAVFLDVDGDRYFCLPRSLNEAFLRIARDGASPGDASWEALLIAKGLLVEADEQGSLRSPPSIVTPTHDYVPVESSGCAAVHLMRALRAELGLTWVLRTKPLSTILEAFTPGNEDELHARSIPDRHVTDIVRGSGIAALFTRSHDRCLVRALAVHSLCLKQGVRSHLIFGVVAHPFSAHSWVQLGSAVLVGGYEQARLYTPILVI